MSHVHPRKSVENRVLSPSEVITKNIITKLYLPTMDKYKYNINLNNGIEKIKRSTRENSTENYRLDRKKVEIDKIGEEMLIYNNPSKIY